VNHFVELDRCAVRGGCALKTRKIESVLYWPLEVERSSSG
jgi:hypothetical protein